MLWKQSGRLTNSFTESSVKNFYSLAWNCRHKVIDGIAKKFKVYFYIFYKIIYLNEKTSVDVRIVLVIFRMKIVAPL